MATPRSAGRVLIKPMGDYNPATTYEMLDAVEYDGSTYLCKQTSTGNLPTNKTYWQKMISVGADDFMAIDGSNADNVIFGGSSTQSSPSSFDTVTKSAGDNQTVVLTDTASTEAGALKLSAFAKAHIGDDEVYYTSPLTYIVIDSVSVSSLTVTVNAHLKVDDSAAISLTNKTLQVKNYIKSNTNKSLVVGTGSAVNGNNSLAVGSAVSVVGNYSVGEGQSASINANYAHAEGYSTYAGENAAHAEGYMTAATGMNSHAEGSSTVASGTDSHAEGTGTIAGYTSQSVMGRYNDNKEYTVFEIGGGSSNNRANTFEVWADGATSSNNGTDRYVFERSNGKDGFRHASGATSLGNFQAFDLPLYLTQSVTLSTSTDTTVTFSNAAITTDSMIDTYTDVFGVNPTDVAVATGTCTLTFAKVDTAQTISVRIAVRNI